MARFPHRPLLDFVGRLRAAKSGRSGGAPAVRVRGGQDDLGRAPHGTSPMVSTSYIGLIGEVFLALFAVFLILAIRRTAAAGVELDLVQIGGGAGLVLPSTPHLLQVSPTGECFLDGNPVAPSEVAGLAADGEPVVLAFELPGEGQEAVRQLYEAHIPVLLAVDPPTTPAP